MNSVLVCGGGNAGQVATCLFSAQNKVTAISLSSGERWAQAVQEAGCMSCAFEGTNKVVQSVPDLITTDPSAVKHCNVVFLTVPSTFHEQYLEALEPHVQEGTVFAIMPGCSGCDFLFKHVMGEKADKLGLVVFDALPWACRVKDWGKTATMLGTKETTGVAVMLPTGMSKTEVLSKLQGLLGTQPTILEAPNIMSISLANPGQVIHPGVMYGCWQNWDGQPLKEKPLFYQGVDAFTAAILEGMSAEIQTICHVLNHFDHLDKNNQTCYVKPIMAWYMGSYSSSMTDTSNLMRAMNTNAAYEGLCHPVKEAKDGYVPDFQHRYLSEDVPTGLCFTRGVAELLGVKTPMIDQVLYWCQDKLNKEFLTEAGKMAGANIQESRAPQAFGMTKQAELRKLLGIVIPMDDTVTLASMGGC